MTEEKPKTRAEELAVLASLTAGDTLAHAAMLLVPGAAHVPVIDSLFFGALAIKYGPPFLMMTRDRYTEWLKSRSAMWILVIIAAVVFMEAAVSISLCMDTGMLLFDEITFVWLVVPATQELWLRLKSHFGR